MSRLNRKSSRMVRPLALAAAVAAVGVVGQSAGAATLYWDGTSGQNFNTAAAWSTSSGATTPDPASAPVAGDIAVFNIAGANSAQTVNVTANVSVDGLIFNNTGTTLLNQTANRTFLIGASGIVANAGAGAATLGQSTNSLGVTIGATQTWTNNSAGVLTVRNALSNGAGLTDTLTLAGSAGFTFSNTINEGAGSSLSIVIDTTGGTTTFSSTGSYTGGLTVKRGTVSANNGSSFGTGNVLLGDTTGGGNVSVTLGSGTYANNITVQSGSSGTVTLRNAGNSPVLAGTVTLNKDTIFDIGSTNTTTVSNAIVGSGNISLLNGGALQLGTGGTTGGLAAGTTVSGSGVLTYNRSDDITLSNGISGTAGIGQSGTGTLTLTGAGSGIHTGTGATKVNNGTLKLDFTNAASQTNMISSSSALTLGSTSTAGKLVMVGKDGVASTQTFNGTTLLNNDNVITVTAGAGGTATLNLGGITRTGPGFAHLVTNSGATITSTTGSNNALWQSSGGIILGAFGDDWAAKGASGNTLVPVSTLSLYTPTTSTTVSGIADVASGVDTTLSAGATITSLRFNQNEARTIDLNGNTVSISTGGILVSSAVNTAGSKIIGGTLKGSTGSSKELVVVQNSATPFEIGSTISNSTTATAFSKHGSGTLILTGANDYTGTTLINTGVLQIGAGGTSGTLGTGAITNLAALSINRSDAMTIGGIISGAGSVQQIGSGTTTFSGANTYTGGLTIQRGTAIGTTSSTAFGAAAGTITLGDAAGGANNASMLLGTTGLTVASPIVLASNTTGTLTIGNTSDIAAATFSGAITGTNALTLNNSGTTTNALTLSGAIGHTGAIASTGSSSGTTTLSNTISSSVKAITHTGSNGLTISGATVANIGDVSFNGTGGGVSTFSAASITTDGWINNAGTTTGGTTISGALGASVKGVTQSNPNNFVTLSGTNTAFNGPVNVSAGTLKLGSATALGGNGSTTGTGGALTLAGGTTIDATTSTTLSTTNAKNINGSITYGGSSTLNMGPGAVTLGAANIGITNQGASTLTLGGAVSGTSNLTLAASAGGGFTLSGNVNNAGSVSNNGAGAGAVTLSGGIGSNVNGFTHSSAGGLTISGSTMSVLVDGDMLFNGSSGAVSVSAGTINPTGIITNSGTTSSATTLSGVLGGAIDEIVQNTTSSRLNLTGSNTALTAILRVKAGELYTNNVSSLGTGKIYIGGSTSTSNVDATIMLGTSSPPPTATNAIDVLASSNSGTLTIGTLSTSGSTGFSGAITLFNDLTISKGGGGAGFTVSGGITGTGDVTFKNNTGSTASITVNTGQLNFDGVLTNSGSGPNGTSISSVIGNLVDGIVQNSSTSALSISASNPNFAGSVDVQAGTFTASNATALSNANVVTIASGGAFNIGTSTLTVAGVNGAGNIGLVSGATRTLTMGGSGTYANTGTVSNSANTLNLVKSGAGSQTLGGTLSYNGTTAINGGLLSINGTQTGAGAYSINSGGTLGGNGSITTVNANVTLASGGKIAPGTSPGTLTFDLGSGTMSLVAGVSGANVGALVFELQDPETGPSDQVKLTNALSTLDIGSGVLEWTDFSFTSTSLANGTYVLFDTAKPINGTLSTTNKSGVLGGIFSGELSISPDGTDVVLTVVPEPASLSLLALGGMSLLRRRRKTA